MPARSRDETRGSQLLKGVLDMLLLALIAEQPRYGYQMVEELGRRGLHLVSEGSIYPVLARLERAGYVQGYFEPSPQGPPRKYYRTLPHGQQVLHRWVDEWHRFARGVDAVVAGQPAVGTAVPASGRGDSAPDPAIAFRGGVSR
ncbi:PadR family transcriptional regulator [Thermaerobacter subterraneus]|uniref:Transcriptional regulator n=1 Tax=Thermaerobacter subterraneus DSM 13965 TaxID=867903 RepID=K6QET3_9FIRM|nr:PadR family transcriptional regulator [Thermaerobacter subterraneus]EKP95401.1 putative transcriptional regulator [Thermaerobacter subterraneus DSM 13965]